LREELFILASCCLSPMRRNSVLEEFRVSRLAVIQEEIHCNSIQTSVFDIWHTTNAEYLLTYLTEKTAKTHLQ